MSETLIKVQGVSKKFCRNLKRSLWYGMQDLCREVAGRRHGGQGELRPDEFWAVKEISFELKRGKCLGLIGHNGAGKTTLLRMLNGLIKPDRGRIEMRGRMGALIALGAGFNPILTGRENIFVNASVLGLSKREIDVKIDEIIDFAEIDQFIDMPVQSYSSGMVVRLGFSIAATLRPDILIVDEILAVGDNRFRAKSYQKIGELMTDTAVVIVSHNEAQLSRLCNSVLWINEGGQKAFGPSNVVLDDYLKSFDSRSPKETNAVCCENVISWRLNQGADHIHSGEAFRIKLEIDLKRPLAISSVSLHFSKSGDFICHAAANGDQANKILLKSGKNHLDLAVENLYLVSGAYGISLILYEGNDRKIVLQCIDEMRLNVFGPATSSSCVRFPMEVIHQ